MVETPGRAHGRADGTGFDDAWKDVESARLGERHSPNPDLERALRAGEYALPGTLPFNAILLYYEFMYI